MSSAYQLHVDGDNLPARPFFSPTIVPTDSLLDTMRAVRDCYGYGFRSFLGYMGERGGNVDHDAVLGYYTALNADEVRRADGTPYRNGSKRILRQAVRARLRASLSTLSLDDAARMTEALRRLDREAPAPKVAAAPVPRSKVLSHFECTRLTAAASPRDRLIVAFLWSTGCRVSEATGARLSDCTPEGDAVDIRVVGKGNKERHVQIRATLYQEIRAAFPGDVFLFSTASGRAVSPVYASGRVAALGRRILGRKISAHCLRHSFASRKVRGADAGKVESVSRYLGHSSPSITMSFYVHGTLEAADLFDGEDVV